MRASAAQGAAAARATSVTGTGASAAAHSPRDRAAPAQRWPQQTWDEGAGSSAGQRAAALLLALARESAFIFGRENRQSPRPRSSALAVAAVAGP